MPGAGSGSLAFGKEGEFMNSLQGAPDYWGFGRNPTITDLSLDNQLQRLRAAGAVQSVESVKQNFEGAVNVEAVVSSDVHSDVEDLVFNDGGTGFTNGEPAYGRVFAGIDFIGGVAERALKGCIPVEYTLNYEQGGMLTYSLNMLYAGEDLNTEITPSSITEASEGTSVPWHGATLTIDSGTVADLQSAALSISEIARFTRGASPTPTGAVNGPCTTTLDATALFNGPTRTELAYGEADATSPQDAMTSVSGSLELADRNGTVSTYDLPNLKPDTASWNDVLSGDTNTTDQTTFNVDGEVTVS